MKFRLSKRLIFACILLLAEICLPLRSFSESTHPENSKSFQIVTTILPELDFVQQILGDNSENAEVTMLLHNGVDFHSFQPTAADILKISTADLFIYVGGESDEWVEDALQEAGNQDRIVLKLMDALGSAVKVEEVAEGMQEEDHEHEREEGEKAHAHEQEEGEIEYDEHIWLSVRNAVTMLASISEAIQEMDPDHKDLYRENAADYTEKLNALDAEYEAAVSGSSVRTILFGDRFPFRYLADDYGLSYYAAFVGCSAETEASFETIAFLARKVDELSLNVVLTIEGTDHQIAETIVKNTKSRDQRILTMDSMQSVTNRDIEEGTTYLSVMEEKLSVLKDALTRRRQWLNSPH